MIQKYNDVSIIYGGRGRRYAEELKAKVDEISQKERFPLSANIILEKILTRELLTDVMNLFRESEFCVAFLTADDCCTYDDAMHKRLRQNVVFEIGMAMIQMGRERCILLSDFDIESTDFDLPSDMNSLEILQFDPSHFDKVLDNIIEKLLTFSQTSLHTGNRLEAPPQYNNLFTREDYYVDYENLFVNRPVTLAVEGKDFFRDTLNYWRFECESLPHYDEKCIYLFERIGFLPIFGHIKEANEFLLESSSLIENYKQADIRYYNNVDLLNFVRNVASCVIEYTRIKTEYQDSEPFRYEKLLRSMLSEPYPEAETINPLISVVYYDYLGLTYLRVYRANKKEEDLDNALKAFKQSVSFIGSVDMSLQIWSGFLFYNIARVYAEMEDTDNAVKFYEKAINIRERWLRTSKYNVTIRNALSYEYFIAKIRYIDMRKLFSLIDEEEIAREYSFVETELNKYSDIDEKLDQLLYIRQLLNERKNTERK